jgi:hypothetical protein
MKYKTATATDLAAMLLKYREASFAARYETDDNGAILEAENWFGATIVNQFNGQCILITYYGGGLCFAYNVTQINDTVPIEVAESTFDYFLHHDLKISGETVCVEVTPKPTPKSDGDSFEFNRIKAHVGHNIEAVIYGDDVNASVECIDCNEVIYSVDNPSISNNNGT